MKDQFLIPFKFKNGALIKNRIVMAPMTEMSAFENGAITKISWIIMQRALAVSAWKLRPVSMLAHKEKDLREIRVPHQMT